MNVIGEVADSDIIILDDIIRYSRHRDGGRHGSQGKRGLGTFADVGCTQELFPGTRSRKYRHRL